MAARKPSCKGCCVLQKSCTACARCLPRYLCVDVVVTPGPYTDIHCCDPDEYGQGYFSFRLTQTCGAWSGSGTCPRIGAGLSIGVALSSSCNTVVTTSLDPTPFAFSGTLPGMSGTSYNEAGDQFDWSISNSCSVVENPRISDKCVDGKDPPCSCATCLPRKLCFTYEGILDGKRITGAASLVWDCLGNWIAETLPEGVSVIASLKDTASGICGIDISISTLVGSYSGTIVLEGPLDSRKIHGTICKDSDGLEMTLGVPELKPCPPGDTCTDPPPQGWDSFIAVNVNLTDLYGNVTGTAVIRDQSCGDCKVPSCSTATMQTACCINPLPVDLFCTITSSNCPALLGMSGTLSGALESDAGGIKTWLWEGPVGCINVQMRCVGTVEGNSITLEANPPLSFSGGAIGIFGCDPFLVSTTLSYQYTYDPMFPDTRIPCCPATVPPGSLQDITCTFVITA